MLELALLLLVAGCGDDDASTPTRDAGGPPDTGAATDAGPALTALDCEVVIVGGGAGGLYTAFRLAPELGDGVCLFEREPVLGGRIFDVPRDPSDPMSPVWGTGALRVMEGQAVLFELATELGLTLEQAPGEADLIHARGLYAFGKQDFVPRYGFTPEPSTMDQETFFYDALRFGPARMRIGEYADFRAYGRDVVGGEGWTFLRDMSRFRADFEYPLDARGYLDYLDEEWDVCCAPSYPVGGMSAFIRGMQERAVAGGARIFTSQPVREIRRSGDAYDVLTDTHRATAPRVVIAVPPVALDRVGGDVADRIRSQAQYQSIIAVKVATVTQWWPTRWWDSIRSDAPESNRVWRSWTTDHCVNFVEIPLAPYGVSQNVTRSVYDDDLSCVSFWEETLRSGGIDAVEAEVRRGLEMLFADNGLTMPPGAIPDPTRTHVQIWPAAWHWLRAGSDYTNADIFAWAAEPLPGEEVALVGEAYNPQRSGWSDGAYKSAIQTLNTRYGMSIAIPTPMATRTSRARRSQGGH